MIRHLAAEYHITLVDGVVALEAAAANGILGNDLFSDGHHPNLRGYWILAPTCADALAAVFDTHVTRAIASPDEMSSRFGLGARELAPVVARWP